MADRLVSHSSFLGLTMKQLKLTPILGDMSEWDKRWTSVLNEVGVYEVYKRTGRFPKAVVDAIGQETLSETMSNFVKHVKDFFKWLGDRISAAISAVRRFFRRVATWILGKLGGKFSNGRTPLGRLTSFLPIAEVRGDYKEVYKQVAEVIKWYCKKPVKVDPYSPPNVEEGRKGYTQVKSALEDSLSSTEETRMSTRFIIAYLDAIYQATLHIPMEYTGIERVCDKISNEMTRFASSYDNEETVLSELKQTCLSLFGEMSTIIDVSLADGTIPDNATNRDHLDALRRMCNFAMMILSFGSESYARLCKWMKKQYKTFAGDKQAIDLEVRIPEDLKEHLEEQYGRPLRPKTVFITSLAAHTWNQFAKLRNGFIAGMTQPSYSDPKSPDCIWINANILVGKGKDMADAVLNDAFRRSMSGTAQAEALLSVIVHEFCHVSDLQNGDKFNMKLPYKQQPHEIRAKDMERMYTPTRSELEWAEGVIQQLEAQYNSGEEAPDILDQGAATV